MEQEFLRFLYARGIRSGDDHFDVGRTLGEAAVATEQRDGDHAATPRLFEGGQNVAGLARTGNADEHITALPEAVHLTGERVGKVVVIADRGEQAAIDPEGHGGIGPAITDEPADEFGRDVRGIRGAAAIAAEQKFAARGKSGHHGIGGTQQRLFQRAQRIERLACRKERSMEVSRWIPRRSRISSRRGHGARAFRGGCDRCKTIHDRGPFDIGGQTFFHARMHLRSGLFIAALFLASCSTPPKPVELVRAPVLPLALDDDFEFRKVKRFLNQPALFQPTQNETINFERSRVNFGALSADERRQRQGTYFDIFWRANRTADLTVRLEYRQAKLGNDVRAQEIAYSQARGTVKTSFAVTGDNYLWDGPVTAWRCLLIENNRIVAFTQSYLWK